MNPIQTFDPQQQQRPATPSHMETVINAIDRPVRFEICGHPSSPAAVFDLQPGQMAQLPKTYCEPIAGANPAVPRPSVLAQLSSCTPYPDAAPIQAVVPLRFQEETRRAWEDAKRNRPKVSTVMLHDTQGKPVPLSVPIADARTEYVRGDGEDGDELEIEEPPPGAPDLRPGAAAALQAAQAGPAPVQAAVKTVGKSDKPSKSGS